MTNRRVVLIGISGCSSSGKTTLSKLTSLAIPDAILIHEDDFYKHDDDIPINEKYQIADWDCAEALDLNLFKKELDGIRRSGVIASKLIHNENLDDIRKFNIDQTEWKSLLTKYETISGLEIKIVLVDGFMIFNDKELADKFDVKIFVRAPYSTLKKRRQARAGYQTLDSYWVDPPYYFDEFVYKSYKNEHKHMFIADDVEGKLKTGTDVLELMNDDDKDINIALRQIADYILKYL